MPDLLRAPKRIVVRCPNWVGDLVMCTPALRSLRRRFPEAHISAIVKPSLRPVIRHLPLLDDIIEYEPRGRDRGLRAYLRFVRRLRDGRFDMGIAFTSSFSSAQLLLLAGIPVRVGYSRNLRGWMLTHRKQPQRRRGRIVPVNKVMMDLGLCELLGCDSSDTRPQLDPGAEAAARVDDLCGSCGVRPEDAIVVMVPGATFGPSKCWKQEYFAQVADRLIEAYGAKIFLAAGPGELPIARTIQRLMRRTPVDLGDRILPLDELMALIKRSALVITNDTGPRHFAVAFDRPVVVIMGSTDPRHTDCNLDKTVVLQEQVACGPCHLRQCPTDHRCMTRITPDRVYAAAAAMLDHYHGTQRETA